MFWVCTVVFVLVIVFLIGGTWRGRRAGRSRAAEDPMALEPMTERRMTRTIIVAVVVTVITLFGLLVASVATGRSISPLRAPADALTVKVIGHQWWWDFEYQHPDPSRMIRSPNELHIPVGRPVKIQTTSVDVIHSFWVPNLHGKLDLIPGRTGDTWIQADRPGVYRGQCAEFCGFQHANMALQVIAEPADRFQAWLVQQRREAAPPSTPLQARGKQLVEILPCANCHTVRGTLASGKTAPDLTHLASRRTIAAGTLPNNRGNLGGWIADPQTVKPGNHMPSVSMPSEELEAVLAYLETLK
jgi:cytochrome c oxidase subunit 2